jgi:hypothetical protein
VMRGDMSCTVSISFGRYRFYQKDYLLYAEFGWVICVTGLLNLYCVLGCGIFDPFAWQITSP